MFSLSRIFLLQLIFSLSVSTLFASKVLDDYNIQTSFFCENGECKDKKDECKSKDCSERKLLISKYKQQNVFQVENKTVEQKDGTLKSEINPRGIERVDIQKVKNDFLYKNNLTGLYIYGGASIPEHFNISGNARYNPGYDPNAGYFPTYSNPVGFMLGIGVNKSLPYNIFLGVEFFYFEPNAKVNSKWNVSGMIVNGSFYAGQVDINSTTSYRRSLGFKTKIGFHVWRLAVYGIIGYSYNMLTDSSYGVNQSFSNSSSIGAHGIVFGGGAEFYITNYLFFKVEYFENLFSYETVFSSIYTTSSSGLTSGNNLTMPSTIRIGTLFVGVGLKFTI